MSGFSSKDEVDLWLYKEDAESRIRVNEYNLKANASNARHFELYKGKQFLAEMEREKRRGQIEKMYVGSDGRLRVETQNLSFKGSERLIANFNFPAIKIWRSVVHSEEEIYEFSCRISDQDRSTFLNPIKCTSGMYMINKFLSIGAKIFAPNLATEKNYARNLITILINNANEIGYLPERNGWIKDQNLRVYFQREGLTWEKVKKWSL